MKVGFIGLGIMGRSMAKGLSYGGQITLLSGMQPTEEFSTLAHEIGHLCGAEIYVASASGRT